MKPLIASAIAVILFVPTTAPAYREIRNGSGDLIGTETRVGDRTEIRDRDNNLVGETNRQGSRTIIRNGSGDQIGEVDRNRGDND